MNNYFGYFSKKEEWCFFLLHPFFGLRKKFRVKKKIIYITLTLISVKKSLFPKVNLEKKIHNIFMTVYSKEIFFLNLVVLFFIKI